MISKTRALYRVRRVAGEVRSLEDLQTKLSKELALLSTEAMCSAGLSDWQKTTPRSFNLLTRAILPFLKVQSNKNGI